MSKHEEDLLRIFSNLDQDGNKEVNRGELEKGLNRYGWSETRICTLMEQLDMNGDGKITLNEYKLALGINVEPMGEWKRLFDSIDRDRTGSIDKVELRKMFKEMGMNFNDDILEEWIADHDVDGDGKLNYKEFLGFVAEQADM